MLPQFHGSVVTPGDDSNRRAIWRIPDEYRPQVPLLAVGVLAAAFLNLALVFVPVGVGAQTSPSPMTTLSQDPCFSTSAAADQIIAACTALLRSGTLSATNTAAYYNRALAYYGKGQFDLAIADYTAVLRINPKDADAYYNRGLYDAALKIDTNLARAYLKHGILFFDVGRFSESALDLKRSVELEPSDVFATLFLHVARLRSRDNDADFQARSTSLDATKWSGPILGLYLGRQTPEQTLATASDATQSCAASFFVAEWQLWRHETALAQTGFARALEICPHSSLLLYDGARAELARLPK